MENDTSLLELSSIDTKDWHNIPGPLVKSIAILKKCVLGQLYSIKENTDQTSMVSKETEAKLQVFESELKSLKKSIVNSEDSTKKHIKELTDTVNEFKSTVQINLNAELDFIKKHNEGKFSYIDSQLQTIQTFIKPLPSVEDVEARIRYKIRENSIALRQEIKEDIKSGIIEPEVQKLRESLFFLETTFKIEQGKINEDISKLAEKIGSVRSELIMKVDEVIRDVEDVRASTEKNTLDLDSELLKVNLKINESKKGLGQIESSVASLSTAHQRGIMNIKNLKNRLKATVNEVKQVKEFQERQTAVTLNASTIIKDSLSYEKSQQGEPLYLPFNPPPNTEEFANIREEYAKIREEFKSDLQKVSDTVKNKTNRISTLLENSLKSMKSNYSEEIEEIKEKLHWLPLNLRDIKGMPPSEARIFILEARLRSEENIRNEQFNKILSLIDNLKVDIRSTSEDIMQTHILPSINSGSFDAKTPEVRSFELKKQEPIKSRLPKQGRLASMSVDFSKYKHNLLKKH